MRVSEDIEVQNADGSTTTVHPNDPNTPSEGTCLPRPNNDLEVANAYVAKPILTKIDDALTFTIACKYPGLFDQASVLGDCDIYTDPCAPGGVLHKKSDPSVFFDPTTGEKITFDPMLDGECRSEDPMFVGVLDPTFGPSLEKTTFANATTDYANVPEFAKNSAAYVSTADSQAMIAAGIRPSVARYWATERPTYFPKPCMVDPIIGEIGLKNYYDAARKQCRCDTASGWIPVFMTDESLLGNYVDVNTDSPNEDAVNGCVRFHNVENDRSFFAGGAVNSDGSAEELKTYNASTLSYPPLSKTRFPALANAQGTVAYLMPRGKNTLVNAIRTDGSTYTFYSAVCEQIFAHYQCDEGSYTQKRDTNCSNIPNLPGSGRIGEINRSITNATCKDDISPATAVTHGLIIINPTATRMDRWNTIQVTSSDNPSRVNLDRAFNDGVKSEFLFPL